MNEILTSLRSLLVDHLSTSQSLTSNTAAGSDLVYVANTSRFRAGDEAFLMSATLNKAEPVRIRDVIDYRTLQLFENSVPGWTTSNGSFIQKAIAHEPLRRAYIGDLKRIPDFPTITISPDSEDNEWWSLGATDHDFKLSIRVYVQTANFEESNIVLTKYAQAIREILIDHIHPIIEQQTEYFPLTADLIAGSLVVSLTDTSDFVPNQVVFIRDAEPRLSSTENIVLSILSPTELELNVPVKYDYLVVRQAEIIRVNRYLYDTRPSNISYGYVPGSGGSLLRAAEIKWYGKEVRCREGNRST
jgi:hypothetical protein